MVSCGRVVCVALPFLLAVVSIVALLVATLAGVANKNMSVFTIDTTNLSISATDLASLVSRRSLSAGYHNPDLLKAETSSSSSSSSSNITASELGLAETYDISIWNYCYTWQNGTRTCTQPAFNWASKTLNTSDLDNLVNTGGYTVTLPKEMKTAIKSFDSLSRWTQIVYIIALAALVVEIFFGLFTSCSRGISCLTFLVASITAVAVTAAAGLSTAVALVVVAAVDASAKKYGLAASFDGGYLAAVWIAAGAAIAASFFWMFTLCCCKPESRVRSGPGPMGASRNINDKAGPPGSYQPLHDPADASYHNTSYAPQYGAPRHPVGGRADLAYEPYSHGRV